jgi:hypothetical protein
MIANVSPAQLCCEHSLNTLRYGDRVKELKNESGGFMDKNKELLLARSGKNTRIIQLDQRTGKPVESFTTGAPTLKQGNSIPTKREEHKNSF